MSGVPQVLYVYAIGRRDGIASPPVEGVDGTDRFVVIEEGELAAIASRVEAAGFSQETIDAHASDLDWLGAIGYRHQDVVGALFATCDIVPLRAFTLFSNEQALREHLLREQAGILNILERVRGREEWTLRISFDHEPWEKAVESRSPRLAELAREAAEAPAGRAYLLRKKMDEQKKNAARECEREIVSTLEQELRGGLPASALIETRAIEPGVAPQIDVLLPRGERDSIETLHRDLQARLGTDGIELALSGPWPPYTFVSGAAA